MPLQSFYAERKLILIFLRHFGCVFCKEQVSALRMHDSLNAVFVSMGSPEEAQEFKTKMRSPHTFLCDPDRKLYEAFGLGRAETKQVFSPKVFSRGFGATLRGHFVGMPIGDPWQMPGVFLVETDGTTSWEYRSVDASDNPDTELLLQLS